MEQVFVDFKIMFHCASNQSAGRALVLYFRQDGEIELELIGLSEIDKMLFHLRDWIQFVKLQRISIVDLNGTYWSTKDSRIAHPCRDMINEIQAVTLNCGTPLENTDWTWIFLLVLKLQDGTH
jgi:hypothetical protein